MKKIKFGLKLWSINNNLCGQAKKAVKQGPFDYIELTIVPETNIDPFLGIGVPFIVHAPTSRWGINIADHARARPNLKEIKNCIKWAKKLNASHIILHPGYGNIQTAQNFLNKINNERFLIENMTKIGLNNESMIGFSPGQIERLIRNKFGFCMDFNHAAKAAISLKKNYKKYIEDFLKLNPKIFHISDGTLKNEKDKHLNIGDGEYDFNFLAKCIRMSHTKYVTLETPRTNLRSLKEDLENVAKLKSFLFL